MKIEKMKLFWGCVLKYRFNYYPGMVTLTNPRDDCHGKDSLLFTFPKKKGFPCHAGPHGGSTRVSPEAEGMRGKHGREPLLCFP